jgi:hypothetical protein
MNNTANSHYVGVAALIIAAWIKNADNGKCM